MATKKNTQPEVTPQPEAHVSHYAAYKAAHLKYQESEKGQAARKRYQESEKGKAARKAYQTKRNALIKEALAAIKK
jgi:hypothetical protein